MIYNLLKYWLKQSVSRVLSPGKVTLPRVVAIHLGLPLPAASSSQPGGTGGSPLTPPYLALLLAGFTWHPSSPADPVSSYLTLSPLPAEAGGLLSVALIPGVTPAGRYPAPYPVEPGLSSLREKSGHLSCFSQSVGTVFFRSCCLSLRLRLCDIPLGMSPRDASTALLERKYPRSLSCVRNFYAAGCCFSISMR